ncbi:MAG: phage shock protein operon transcriptional activator [Gammaproteobacteria bacterium]|nr:phage shock protein operon transcriptional activator [Gammaproteobacteria bacterium]
MTQHETHKLIGESASFLNALEQISQVASLNKPVLIIGERGTGKELFAERLHFLSSNWDNTLIKLNCSALPETLLESELFGHEAGSFTGATKRHLGRFEQADGGTLFLDEIANMSLRLQEKLLRVVEYGEFERVGGRETLSVNVRIVGAANMDLPLMVEQGKFRADLLDRLSFDVITLPPLRFREDDIPLLSDFFATGMIKELKRDFFPGFTDESMHHLVNYAWPGNLRELKNVIERAVYRCQIDTPIDHIDFDPFESPFRPLHNDSTHQADETIVEQEVEVKQEEVKKRDIESLPHDFKAYIQQHEIELLQRALDQYRFNQRKTADALGLSYHQIRAYLRKYPSINSKID